MLTLTIHYMGAGPSHWEATETVVDQQAAVARCSELISSGYSVQATAVAFARYRVVQVDVA